MKENKITTNIGPIRTRQIANWWSFLICSGFHLSWIYHDLHLATNKLVSIQVLLHQEVQNSRNGAIKSYEYFAICVDVCEFNVIVCVTGKDLLLNWRICQFSIAIVLFSATTNEQISTTCWLSINSISNLILIIEFVLSLPFFFSSHLISSTFLQG